MSRRFITQLGERESINQIFLASEKQLRTNRNGNYYLQLRLLDRSGLINAMMWNANDHVYKSFDNGDYVLIEGTTQFHNGNLQIIVSQIAKADAREVDEADFIQVSTQDTDRMAGRLREILRGITNFHLRNLAECYLLDEQLMGKFLVAPAGIKNHHAYRSGLLEHVLSLSELCLLVADHYPQVDKELLLIGAFLHDIGKVDELSYERDLGYTDQGQMIGHMVMAACQLDAKVREAEKLSGEPFPPELAMRVKHMIISHHGEYEFGSPKLPMTLEATALHYLDNLDAKLHSFSQLMREDPNADSNWTSYQPNIGRKLYKKE